MASQDKKPDILIDLNKEDDLNQIQEVRSKFFKKEKQTVGKKFFFRRYLSIFKGNAITLLIKKTKVILFMLEKSISNANQRLNANF